MDKSGSLRFRHLLIAGSASILLSACVSQPTQQNSVENGHATQDEVSEASHETIHVSGDKAASEYDSVTVAREIAAIHSDEDSGQPEIGISEPSLSLANQESADLTDTPIALAEPLSTSEATIDDDIWHRIRDGFSLPDAGHAKVTSDRDWFARNQAYLNRTFKRAEPYLYDIVSEVEKRGVPMEIALLPVVESAFQPFAYSHGRAAGIWQFIPGTGRRFGLKINWWYDGRRDIQAATTAALDYLIILNKEFDGDWLLALAAYNTGEGNVRKAIRYNKRKGRGTEFWDLKLPRETRGYVPKLLGLSQVIANPEKFGVTLPAISNEPRLAQVDLGSQLDLAIAADMANLTLEELYILNPGYNQWATAPDGPHTLLLPLDKIAPFKEKLAALPDSQRVKWLRHKIGEGESLGVIAEKYNTTASTIRKVNKIRGNMIRAGKHLLIPTASRTDSAYALSADNRLQAKQNTPKGAHKTNYTVRNGDTLWDISIAHKVSVRKLASWNGMAPKDMLRPGQKLVIWSSSASSRSSATQGPAANPMAQALTRKIKYRVRNGDSLARISQRFNVSVAKLKKWNPSARGKYIQPGQSLLLYVDVTNLAEST